VTARPAAPFRCAAASLAADEDLAGTGSTVGAVLLLEHGGPWGVSALRDAALPADVGASVQQRCAAAGVRPLLMRRHRARPGVPARPRVVVAAVGPSAGRAVSRTLDDVREAVDLDLPALVSQLRADEVPAGWDHVRRLLLTCTHGRHDACCAERGRPVALALHTAAGEDAWEVSHIGGDRFAGNVLALPDGLYYGRVPPERAAELAQAHSEGRCVPDLLRGRTSLPFPVQAAEVALRRHLGADALGDVVPAARQRSGTRTTTRTTTWWTVAGRGTWRVVVDTAHPGPVRPLTCSTPAAAPPVHTVVELTDVGSPGRGAQGWDEAHAGATAGDEPNPVVVEAARGLGGGRALDLCTGTGRHALWLARRGWHVTGVDFSFVGLAVARAAGEAERLAVDWQLSDVRVWSPPPGDPGYDLVLMAFVQLPEVVRRARAWLAPGGRLVVVGHSLRNLTEGVGGPSDPRLLHTLEALRENAGDLEIERLEEVRRPADGGRHAIDVVLVARRG
jgi:SAM-dependent methyltransferase